LQDQSIDEGIILKWILKKLGCVWTGFVWLRVGYCDRDYVSSGTLQAAISWLIEQHNSAACS
jgi:hypothetical protein